MVTSFDVQTLIVADIGDTPDQLLANLMPKIWAAYADKAVYPRLQELYTKRRCLDIVRASLRNQVTFSVDGALSLRLGDRVKYLEDMRAETQQEITKWEAIYRANRPAVIGQLVNTELETPPPPYPPVTPMPDSTSPVYQGDAYYGTRSNDFGSEPGSGR